MNELRGSKEFKDFFGDDDTANKMFEKLAEIDKYKAAIKAGDKQYISSWMTTTANINSIYSFMSDSSQLLELATKSVYDKLDGIDPKDYIEQNSENITNELQSYEDFWNTLSLDQQTKFNSMMSNYKKYSSEDIIKEFKLDTFVNENGELIYQSLIDNLNTKSTEISTKIRERLGKKSQGSLSSKLIKDTNRIFTLNEEILINQLESQINERAKLGLNTDNLLTRFIRHYFE